MIDRKPVNLDSLVKGVGLGLAQVYGIVRQHEGYIDVESAPQEGTTFYIYFPCIETPFTLEEEKADDQTPQGQGETLLVVEDADQIRLAIKEVLESMNYRVLTAKNGREALDMLMVSEVDLVLTDMVMPEMSGRRLLSALEERIPDLDVIAMTGYVNQRLAQDLRDSGFSGVITKPFSIEKLAVLLRDTLNRQG
jgi:two-component system, cell cycle sensor histidine kinase and response regulator CckA